MIITKSKNAAEILQASEMLKVCMHLAKQRLRYDVSRELLQCGIAPTEDKIACIIDGFDEDEYTRLIAERT